MKILYVSDNRVRGNFGCRATSTALSQLIRKNHEIVGVITGKYTNTNTNNLFYFKYLPGFVYKQVGKWKNRHKRIKEIFLYGIIQKISRIFSSHYYAGPCDFVSLDFEQSVRNLKKCLPANPYLEEFNLDNYDFDAMVVNGEGSFIFSTPEWNWREALVISMLIYWAQQKGKKVYFVNAMFSDESTSERNYKMLNAVDNLLSKCNLVSVREEESYNYALKYLPHINSVIFPDALFTWYSYINDSHKVTNYRYYIPHSVEADSLYDELDFSSPYICIAGSSSAKIVYDKQKTIDSYINLVLHLKSLNKSNIYLIEVDEQDSFLHEVSRITKTPIIPIDTPILSASKILANCRVFISGRYHPAIMASMGGTPCIFMGSNSHKTHSLQKLLNYNEINEFSEIPSEDTILQISQLVICYIDGGDVLRSKIKKRTYELSQEASKLIDNLI